MARYSVWSLMPTDNVWLEVGEDLTKREAEASVAAKLRAAAKYRIPDEAAFIALPAGRRPTQADLDEFRAKAE